MGLIKAQAQKKLQAMEWEFCSLPNTFCSFPTEIPKILMRELTHASVNYAGLKSCCVR